MKMILKIALGLYTFTFWFNSANGQLTTTKNFIVTNTIKQSGIKDESQIGFIPIAAQGKTQVTVYLDGMDRPVQQVMTGESRSLKDITQPYEYDQYGRQVIKYLPYVDIAGINRPASYKSNWNLLQPAFYNGQLQGVEADNSAHRRTVFEPSPLNRPVAEGAYGTIWQPNVADAYDITKKVVKHKYEVSRLEDSVRVFNVTETNQITSSTLR